MRPYGVELFVVNQISNANDEFERAIPNQMSILGNKSSGSTDDTVNMSYTTGIESLPQLTSKCVECNIKTSRH
jgi:hypothetical protein